MLALSCIRLLILLVSVLSLPSISIAQCEVNEEGMLAALRIADWECAKEIAANEAFTYSTLIRIFDAEFRAIQNQLAYIKAIIERKQHESIVYLSPAFQWAQSPDEVFLNVKFSHKLDAPATLNVQHNITTEGNRLLLIGTNGVKYFKLELELLRGIISEESSWSSSSNGRITITLKKSSPANWIRLLKDNAKKPSNMHFWFDKQEAYADALEAVESVSSEDQSIESTDAVVDPVKPKESPEVTSTSTPEAGEAASLASEEPPVTNDVKNTEDTKLQRSREEARKRALDDLERERTLRLKEADTKAKVERAAVERDIEKRRREILASEDSFKEL